MPYESLGNELESRLGRKAEFRNQVETLDFRSENWSGDEEGQLAKALAKARERAKQVRKPLKIERLPHRDQRSLKDFEKREAETFGVETLDWLEANKEYAPTELIIKRLKESGVWELGDDPYAGTWDAINWWATVKIQDGTLVRAIPTLDDRFNINIILIVGEMAEGYGRVTVSYTDIDNANWEDSYPEEMEQLGKELTIIFKNNGMFQSGDSLEYGDMGEFYNVVWGDLVRHDCATNADLDIYEDDFIVMECNTCGRTATFRQETPYEGPRNAETFDAETFKAEDEVIVVEGYRPKRVEAWLSAGNAVIFYVGDRAELRYTHPMSMYQERTLLPSPLQPRQSGQSIINPTGITLADVDELMQVSTGEPWNGKYVLYTDEGNFLFYEPKKFREIKEAETKKPRKRRGIKRWGKHPYARKSSRRAESFDLPETQQRILKYLSQIHPDRIHNWDPPKGLTQREIGETVGVVRTNATKHLNDLIDLGLVKMAKKRPVGERRLQKVYFPTFAGRRVGTSFASESMLLDLDGDGVIEPWEIETQEAMLTGLNHETIQPVEFEAMEKGLGDNLRQAAIEVLQDRTGWIGLDELTRLAAQKMYERKRGRKKSPRSLKGILSRAIGSSRGGIPPFYVTRDGRIYYYGDQDRGEFIKGVI